MINLKYNNSFSSWIQFHFNGFWYFENCFPFFQRFWCVALSMYWCFWIPPVRYLWEINKRSCLPFICSHTSWNAYHLICCSFTKLEVKYSLAMTLQLLPTEDKNLLCMYDTLWRQKQWNIYSRIYNISISKTGMFMLHHKNNVHTI